MNLLLMDLGREISHKIQKAEPKFGFFKDTIIFSSHT